MHQMMLLDSSAVASPVRWQFRILVLLLGITVLHMLAGAALSDGSGAVAPPDSGTNLTQQVSTPSAAFISADALHQTSSPHAGQDFGQNVLLGDVCAAACPDGHVIATALCSMVLAVTGLIGLHCLRILYFLPWSAWSVRTRQVLPSVMAPLQWNGVSLLQLSISRI